MKTCKLFLSHLINRVLPLVLTLLVTTSPLRNLLAFAAAFLLGSASLHATTVIYEPFAQSVAALNGQAASSTGLSGNWTNAGSVWNVTNGSISWGSMSPSGNKIVEANLANRLQPQRGCVTVTDACG